MTRSEILKAAERCVCGDRDKQYSPPEDNFRVIAELWEVYLKAKCVPTNALVDIMPEDVAMMMALLKIARTITGEPKADSYIDLAGYAACAGEIAVGGEV